jgi:integrase
MARKLKGIRRKRGDWQTYKRIHGRFYSKAWPLATPVEEMRDWLERIETTHGGTPEADDGFSAAITTYLDRVKAMPTYAQREAHLRWWAQELGRDRPPRSITSGEIDIVLQGCLEAGLANGTVRKRRTALRSFFNKMFPNTVNPVKGTTNPKEPKPEARDLGYRAVEQAIAAMPEHCSVKPGAVKPLSLAKLRARVIAYTGIPPGILKTIRPHDLSLVEGTVRVEARSKGEGVEARTLPLTADALDAFKAFHVANAYGPFATESVNRSFKRGCRRAGLDPKRVHLYDLRHSFLSQVYRVTRDLATVGRLGLHAEGSVVTARYARGANQEVDRAATQAFSAALATQRQQALKPAVAPRLIQRKRSRKLPTKVARFR